MREVPYFVSFSHQPTPEQNVLVGTFTDECFVIAMCTGGESAAEAVKKAVESSIWGYEHTRTRPFYWEDKRLLMARVMRSANLGLYQYAKKMAHELPGVSLAVSIVGNRHIWIGATGDFCVFRISDGAIETHRLSSHKAIVGRTRKTHQYDMFSQRFVPGETYIMATPASVISTILSSFQSSLSEPENEDMFERTVNQLGSSCVKKSPRESVAICAARKHLEEHRVLRLH